MLINSQSLKFRPKFKQSISEREPTAESINF